MEPIRSKNMVMSSSAIEGQSSTDTCQRLICLMLALGSDSGVDLDGGRVRPNRARAGVHHPPAELPGMGCVDTGTDAPAVPWAESRPRCVCTPADLPEFLTDGGPLLDALSPPWAHTG